MPLPRAFAKPFGPASSRSGMADAPCWSPLFSPAGCCLATLPLETGRTSPNAKTQPHQTRDQPCDRSQGEPKSERIASRWSPCGQQCLLAVSASLRLWRMSQNSEVRGAMSKEWLDQQGVPSIENQWINIALRPLRPCGLHCAQAISLRPVRYPNGPAKGRSRMP